MSTKKAEETAKAAKDIATAPATGVTVWFVVEKHEAIIGDAHHAQGKRMPLSEAMAEACVKQGLGRIEGVASAA